jgi:DNA-binding MarR family transcriptional regulator
MPTHLVRIELDYSCASNGKKIALRQQVRPDWNGAMLANRSRVVYNSRQMDQSGGMDYPMTANLTPPSVDAVVDQWCQLMRALHAWRPGQPRPWFESHVTLPQLKAIGLLAARPSGLSGRELATLLGVGPSAVTPLTDRLVEHGWARREDDRADRRITRIVITSEGQTLLERMAAGQRELIASALCQLELSELEIVDRGFGLVRLGLKRAIAALDEHPPARAADTDMCQSGAGELLAGERIPRA